MNKWKGYEININLNDEYTECDNDVELTKIFVEQVASDLLLKIYWN